MHESLQAFLGMLIGVLLLATTKGHATIIASYTPPTLSGAYGIMEPSDFDRVAAQTFVAKTTASVGLVSVLLGQNGELPSAVAIDLRDTVVGVPSSSVLGTSEIILPELSVTPVFSDADFSPLTIILEEGEMYAVSLSLPGSGGVRWLGNGPPEVGPQPNPFANGQGFASLDGGSSWFAISGGRADLGFIVNAIPEPSTATLMALSLAGLGFARRTRRT